MTQTVSVIVTCFNLERYIEQSLRSALDQQLDRHFEIIAVDDCSTDRSAEIIRSIAGVRYVRTERNSGVLMAMLDGIKAATGEYLFFLDGDDVWEEGKLSACVAAFDADPNCVLVTHDLSFIDQDGRQLDHLSRPGEVLGALTGDRQGDAVIDGILRHLDHVWLGSAFGVGKSLGRVDEFDRWARSLPDPANTYQDWPLAFWVASLPGVTAAYVARKLFRYRLHRANYSGDASTAARAVRNFVRASNTVAAMAGLAEERNIPHDVQEALRSRGRSYAYMVNLYQGRRLQALRSFPAAAADFRERGQFTKELVRLAGVMLMGADRFARIAARR